jgi:hypothetical protein
VARLILTQSGYLVSTNSHHPHHGAAPPVLAGVDDIGPEDRPQPMPSTSCSLSAL